MLSAFQRLYINFNLICLAESTFVINFSCSILLKAEANVDAQDFDGWTPLHAAAHWGQREACEILVEHMCDMDKKNCVVSSTFVFY